MNQKHLLVTLLVLLAVTLTAVIAEAQGPGRNPRAPRALAGTGFTYQGQLKKNGASLTSTCNFTFTLFADPVGTTQIGSPAVVNSVGVINGLFTVQLNSNSEFGATPFNGDARWLRSEVQCTGDGSATTLSPFQRLTPAPIAFALPGLHTQQNLTSTNIIGGNSSNTVSPGVWGATIGGGGAITNSIGFSCPSCINSINANYATIGGGDYNTASGMAATIGGGEVNTASGQSATVGGGHNNTASNYAATIGGGGYHIANGVYATVSGGTTNIASAYAATIGGGMTNNAGSQYTTVGGGANNNANGLYATIGGGYSNTVTGNYATIPGGELNSAGGNYSYAAGRRAKANHQGSFVWADCDPCIGGGSPFSTTAENQFLIRAHGGVGVNTDSPAANTLTIGGYGLRVNNNGTTFAKIQAGTATLGTGYGGTTNVYTVTFPSAFSGTPKVIVTTRNDPDYPSEVPDTFAVTVRRVYTNQFVVNVFRVDLGAGFGQNLRLDWLAWE